MHKGSNDPVEKSRFTTATGQDPSGPVRSAKALGLGDRPLDREIALEAIRMAFLVASGTDLESIFKVHDDEAAVPDLTPRRMMEERVAATCSMSVGHDEG